jgi:molybdate transport system regulatory protein
VSEQQDAWRIFKQLNLAFSRYNTVRMSSQVLQPKFNLWLEKNGRVALSLWRVALLQAVGETGSISGAAERVGVHYRTAWQKIHEMESRLGVQLVETQTGGRGGGGARLTAAAEDYIARFSRLAAEVQRTVEAVYRETF